MVVSLNFQYSKKVESHDSSHFCLLKFLTKTIKFYIQWV